MNKKINRILLLRPPSEKITQSGHPRGIRVPFLLKYLESLLAQQGGYVTHLVDGLTEGVKSGDLCSEALPFDPDMVVIFSVGLGYEPLMHCAASFKKSSGAIIVLVGPDGTVSPKEYLHENSPVDFVLRGESEVSCLKLIEAINGGAAIAGIEGLCCSSGLFSNPVIVKDLDALPFPVYRTNDLRKYLCYYPIPFAKKAVWGHILSTRGCPHSCIFCSQVIRESYGHEVRVRSPENVVEEIESLQRAGANVIVFDDDDFTACKEHVREVCRQLQKRKIRIPWIAHARVDDCDAGILKIMKEAGCVLLRFGVESGSARIIKALGKTTEEGWSDKVRRTFEVAGKTGILRSALFLIGSPGETKEDVEESIALAKALQPDLLQVHYLTPYPGSPAFLMCRDEIRGVPMSAMYHYSTPSVALSRISVQDLERLYHRFYRECLFNFGYVARHFYRFGWFYLLNKNIFLKIYGARKVIGG